VAGGRDRRDQTVHLLKGVVVHYHHLAALAQICAQEMQDAARAARELGQLSPPTFRQRLIARRNMRLRLSPAVAGGDS
jgi:hypothetical protein